MKDRRDLYTQVLGVAANYLGPTSKRLIDRQIVSHLGKQPHDLTRQDLFFLIDWIKVMSALITEDKKVVHEFTNQLNTLSKRAA